ncbi:hypothetical protein M758_6G167200 [Ceratodon purpureus]|uniref:Uncharacterized protein n=1 Tax=Ceratodon purpureus TaxID=3225 RepID=A0A8T0HG38_CERPU|nr:hypothetical protein KC19_6G173600 [Ceratodon purpureus]KAG0614311.1 hypothetical protein M758_6G167200 [Ceratodon purpureus]
MTKGSTQPALQTSQSLTTFALYVALMIVLAVFSRTAISSTFGVLGQVVRGLLYITSWPLYIGLLPVRALIFLTSISMKVVFYAGMAAILYFFLCGAMNFGAIMDTFGAVLRFL